MRENQMWAVKHPQHEEVIVKAPDRLRSISAAAHMWGVRWTDVARECKVLPLGPAPTKKTRRKTTHD